MQNILYEKISKMFKNVDKINENSFSIAKSHLLFTGNFTKNHGSLNPHGPYGNCFIDLHYVKCLSFMVVYSLTLMIHLYFHFLLRSLYDIFCF